MAGTPFFELQSCQAILMRNRRSLHRYHLEEQVRRRLGQAFGFDDKGQALGKLNEKAQEWRGAGRLTDG